MQNRKAIIILAILSLILVLVLVFFIFIVDKQDSKRLNLDDNNFSEQGEEKDKKDKEKQKLFEQRVKDVNILEKAKKEKSAIECEKISDPYMVNQCYKKVAESKSDASICEMITKQEAKRSCLYSVYYSQGLEQKRVDPCYNLKSQAVAERCAKNVEIRNSCSDDDCASQY
mgnify:CR=1 FL=1